MISLVLACTVGPWICPLGAQAARVVVLGAHGRSFVANDRFVPPVDFSPPGAAGAARATAARATAARPTAARAPSQAVDRTVATELARLARTHAISTGTERRYLGSWGDALATVHRLRGTRAAELEAVIENIHGIAATGQLTSSRLPALFLTLDRNRIWWSSGPLLASGQRVEFAGSDLVWEYYAGQGIELQELGSFGKADGLYSAGPSRYAEMLRMLSQLIPLAAKRGGGIAWEYYFDFDGGRPPWTSAMSQATAIEALTRAYKVTGRRSYLQTAHRALPLLATAPPAGVGVRTARGRRYLLYSFAPAPDVAVINGFLQTLVGLYDYVAASHDPRAARLFSAGDAEARAEVPSYDTGAWSLYQPGQEDTLDYHTLVTGFLHALCSRVHAAVYCRTAAHFDADLKTPPTLRLLTQSVRALRPATLLFRLSKVSHVGIVVARGNRTVFLTSAEFGYGVNAFAIPPLPGPGAYTVRLAATDEAGNFHRIVAGLRATR